MVAAVKALQKKKKVKLPQSRRLGGGFDAAPKTSFWAFKDYCRTDIDRKDIVAAVKDTIKEIFPAESKTLLTINDKYFSYPYYVAATFMWQKFGFECPENWDVDSVYNRFKLDLRRVLNKKEQEDEDTEQAVPETKKSPAELVKQKTGELISEVEEVLDSFYLGNSVDFTLYDLLKAGDVPYVSAKAVYDKYLPLKRQIEMAYANDKDAKEYYASMIAEKRLQPYLHLVKGIVDDADKYMSAKKSVRKPRVLKPLSSVVQVKLLQFLPDSQEFKVTSIAPTSVVGAQRLYTFNTLNRVLTEYVSNSAKGFSVKGTTLLNVDELLSRETRLRKPEDFLPIVLKNTIKNISVEWDKLTTKTNKPNARINKHTILLRAING